MECTVRAALRADALAEPARTSWLRQRFALASPGSSHTYDPCGSSAHNAVEAREGVFARKGRWAWAFGQRIIHLQLLAHAMGSPSGEATDIGRAAGVRD